MGKNENIYSVKIGNKIQKDGDRNKLGALIVNIDVDVIELLDEQFPLRKGLSIISRLPQTFIIYLENKINNKM